MTVPALPRHLMLFVALLQGLALLLLHQALELRFWPQGQPQWLFAFYAFALTAPTLLLLALEEGRIRRLITWILPFSLLVALLGFYLGWQATPPDKVPVSSLLWAMVGALSIAGFIALIYCQSLVAGEPLSYSRLFRYSWRNFLTLGLALLFALCVWGLLMLWAWLFRAIQVHFFYDLFTEPWFYYPALALAQGFGVIIFRSQERVIDTITRIQQALMKFLLVLLVFVALLFAAALPFTGLEPLWETKSGSSLILWLQALMLFFVNAVYQDEPDQRPYPLLLHRFIALGVALLPVFSAIAFYGLSLRVQQYGWTVGRCWGFLVWALLALFSLGYLWGLLRFRDNWLFSVSRINVGMGLILLALMLLTASPLLDFRKIAVASQLQRVEAGVTPLEKLDFQYFRRSLARPGYLALENLKREFGESRPDILLKIETAYYGYRDVDDIDVAKDIFLRNLRRADDDPLPDGLDEALHQWAQDNRWSLARAQAFYLQPVDLDGDGEQDYLLVQINDRYDQVYLFTRHQHIWRRTQMSQVNDRGDRQPLEPLLEAGQLELVPPRWQLLKIGDRLFQLREEGWPGQAVDD